MLRPFHIILAEDESIVAIALAEALEGQGYRVTLSSNGHEALMAHAVDPADILVTNLWMPRMGGEELIRAIRVTDPSLPIIVTTGDSADAPVAECRLVVIMKPYPLRQVTATVKRMLVEQRVR